MAYSLIAITMVLPGPVLAQTAPEQALKAAFIYNFAVFTEWPAAALPPTANLCICVPPGSPLGTALVELDMPVIKGRQVLIKTRNSVPNLRNCHILLLDTQDRPELARIKQALQGASVLTIIDSAEPLAGDAIIALAVNGNKRIVFDIDLTAAHQAQLSLSSKLLRLARNIQ